jgi:AcrR family transcriptional regulator
VPDLRPRKSPRQARSRETVEAILEACARLLRAGDYAAVTTNHIAARAGVSVGTLYEFFPNKESIVAALTERRLAGLVEETAHRVEAALAAGGERGAGPLIRGIVEAVSADRDLYRVLLRQAPFVQRLPATRRAVAAAFELGRAGAARAGHRLNLPHPEADAWLVSRMVYHAVLEIAFLEDESPDRALLTEELAMLTTRMLQGRDPRRAPAPRGRRARRARGT